MCFGVSQYRETLSFDPILDLSTFFDSRKTYECDIEEQSPAPKDVVSNILNELIHGSKGIESNQYLFCNNDMYYTLDVLEGIY